MLKFAYAYQTKETKKKLFSAGGNAEIVLPELKKIGYDGIEILIRNPHEADLKNLYCTANKTDLRIASIGTGPMVADDSLTFTSKKKEIREEAISRMLELIVWANEFKTSISIGKLRGYIDREEPEKQWILMKEAFNIILNKAVSKDVPILIEPQNEFSINNLNSSYETIEFIHKFKNNHLGIMLDILHVEAEYGNTSSIEIIEKVFNKIGFFHLSDNDRLTPGEGTFNIKEILDYLYKRNFQHYIGLEINQKNHSLKTAEKALCHLKSLV